MQDGKSNDTLHLAYAEVSIMLMESLMHILLARRVVTLEELQSAVESAIETKEAFVQSNLHPHISTLAAGVLRRLGNSVQATAPRGPSTNLD
jgi:hypothetical protein